MIEVYDLRLQKVAMLENASRVSLTETLNQPSGSKLTFELPYNDPKLPYCDPFRFVRVRDKDRQYGYFRILPKETLHNNTGTETITCEPAIATLVDELLYGYHQLGNLGIYTKDVLQYILSKQETVYWQLGDCEFSRQFEYSWENESLLGALFSVPKPMADDYKWEYDYSVFPWVVHLRRLDTTDKPQSYFRYRKNIVSMRRSIDPSELCTVLYPLGYGEGINQLNIKPVNHGVEYLLAQQDNLQRYGRKVKVLVDRRFQYPDTLKEYAQKQLDALQQPRVSYSLDVLDLFPASGNLLDQPRVGDITRIIDGELGIDIKKPIVSVSISDLFSPNRSTSIEVANQEQDIAGTIADLSNRQRIEQTYAQGATNIYSQTFNDNADAANPAVIKLWIPAETVRVNSVNAIFELDNFRAYSKSLTAQSAQSQTSQSNATQTSMSNGTQTSLSNGQQTSGSSPYLTAASGGGTYASSTTTTPNNTTSAYGGGSTTSYSGGLAELVTSSSPFSTTSGLWFTDYSYGPDRHSHNADHKHIVEVSTIDHSHAIPSHAHTVYGVAHAHGVSIDNHTHNIGSHSHTIAGHTHQIAGHTHQIAGHTHAFIVPAHDHAIVYGIYKGPRASNATLRVDGRAAPFQNGATVDLAPYLSKNSNGELQSGTYHTIEIQPNGLSRINATVTVQLFIQSHGQAS